MRGLRITILLLIFAGTAVAMVGIRIEQQRCLLRIHQLRFKQVSLQQELQAHHLRVARLRSTVQIAGRIERLQLGVIAPWTLPEHENLETQQHTLAMSDRWERSGASNQ